MLNPELNSLQSTPDGRTTGKPLIVCDNLVKIYQVDELEVVALQGLDLEVDEGEFLAIVGASGSGKSSLLNILGGLDRPSAGRASVGDLDLLKLSDQALARYRLERVGFVWQQSSRNLLPYLTALENVELPMLAAGTRRRPAAELALELLDAVGLADRRHHQLVQLSGGQQQRVAIAVALANRPQLLLADEPTGEVDSATAQLIWQAFRRLNSQFGLTTVIVSHDAKISRVVDRVVSIRDGKTSTETVRQNHPGTPEPVDRHAEHHGHDGPEHFEERAVLDAAGRMQLPREFLLLSGIRNRARVQLVDDGILILPTQQEMAQRSRGEPSPRVPEVAAPDLYADLLDQDPLPPPSQPWWRRILPFQRPQLVWDAEPPPPAAPVGEVAAWAAPAAATPLVETQGLTRIYHVSGEEVHALSQVDLSISGRRLVVFKGRSGSGKTTLLNLIGGLDQPTSGRVSLLGHDLSRLSDTERTELRQERVGFVFQSFALMPTFSAIENVEMLLRVAGMAEAERRARALHCLSLVGLHRWAEHRPFEMSGGQQQRLSIARALARRPGMIIADEPTSDLDTDTGRQIMVLFQRLVREAGVTILMASHDPNIDDFASDIYELSDGRIVDHYTGGG